MFFSTVCLYVFDQQKIVFRSFKSPTTFFLITCSQPPTFVFFFMFFPPHFCPLLREIFCFTILLLQLNATSSAISAPAFFVLLISVLVEGPSTVRNRTHACKEFNSPRDCFICCVTNQLNHCKKSSSVRSRPSLDHHHDQLVRNRAVEGGSSQALPPSRSAVPGRSARTCSSR